MKMVCTSDWHPDQSTAGVDRYEDVAAAVNVSVEAALDMKADAYLMCGDLTDPNTVRAHRAVALATDAQTRLVRGGVVPLWLPGNHDVIEDGSGMSTMESLRYCSPDGIDHVMKEPGCFVFQNAKGHTQAHVIHLPFTPSSHPYDPDALVRELADSDREWDAMPVIVCGHLNVEGISAGSETTEMPRGRDVFWPLDALAECFPNAVLVGGHYHAPQNFKGLEIIGSLVRLRFDERNNELGYMVLEV